MAAITLVQDADLPKRARWPRIGYGAWFDVRDYEECPSWCSKDETSDVVTKEELEGQDYDPSPDLLVRATDTQWKNAAYMRLRSDHPCYEYAGMTAPEIVKQISLKQKAAQAELESNPLFGEWA